MNKKILFSILLIALVSAPVVALGIGTADKIAENIKDLTVKIGVAIVVIGWVIAGILYLTAAGDPGKIKTAKAAMIAAIIGTVLVIIAVGGYDVIEGILKDVLGT